MAVKKSSAETIGDRVRAARLAKSWSQDELARAAEIGTLHVSKIERSAIKDPGAATVGKLAAALGISTDALIYGRSR